MKTENNGHITHDSRQPRHESLRRLAAAAAVLVLMVCSFGAGAIFFPRETIVEVPAEQETIALDGAGLTLILPDEWKGKYGVERSGDGTECAVYVKDIHDRDGQWAGLGYLFWIVKEQPMTPEEFLAWSPTPGIYIYSTADATYYLQKHSDVQYDPNDSEEAELYMSMSRQISEIKFQIATPYSID